VTAPRAVVVAPPLSLAVPPAAGLVPGRAVPPLTVLVRLSRTLVPSAAARAVLAPPVPVAVAIVIVVMPTRRGARAVVAAVSAGGRA